MADWQTDCTVRATAYSRRAKAAWDDTTAAIRILADGRRADIEAGDLYLGHLQSLMTRWSRTLEELRAAIDSGNGVIAIQSVEVLGQIATNAEGLAATARARAQKAKAPAGSYSEPGSFFGPEPEPAIQVAEKGVSWLLAFPFGLLLLWLFGR